MSLFPESAEIVVTRVVSNWLADAAQLPGVLIENWPMAALSALVIAGIYLLTGHNKPDFSRSHKATQRSVKRTEDGATGFFGIAIGLYATWQYVVHGPIWIEATKFLLIMALFGQVYALASRWQALGDVPLVKILWDTTKIAFAVVAASSVITVLERSGNYRTSFPPYIQTMDFVPFVRFFLTGSFGENAGWCEFVMQQGLGIMLRISIIYVGLGALGYHIAARYPQFRQHHPIIFEYLESRNGTALSILIILFSTVSNELMLGKFFQDVPVVLNYLGAFLFKA